MFVDDTKLFHRVRGLNDYFKLQRDLNSLIPWVDKWQMQFNYGKCKVIHMGSGNRKF